MIEWIRRSGELNPSTASDADWNLDSLYLDEHLFSALIDDPIACHTQQPDPGPSEEPNLALEQRQGMSWYDERL